MTAEPQTVVAVRDLDFSYRTGGRWLQVLNGVTVNIREGEVLGLVGESGCGKSTLAYTLLGYLRPNARVTAGEVLFRGQDVLAMDRAGLDRLRGNRIGLVPQNPTTALAPHMRVGEQVAEVLVQHRAAASDSAASERIQNLFGLVGLPDPARLVRRYPHELSGGQQQRVCIAMALACDPDLLVLDEPTTGLDVTTQSQIIALLAELRQRLGMAMLYVTHDLGVLAQIADRVGVMYAGHMVEVAPVDTLFDAPLHPYTQGLIASVPTVEIEKPVVHALKGLLRRDELPAGCPFQPRCGFAEPSCAVNRQALETVDTGHRVACQRWRAIAPHVPTGDGAAPHAAAHAGAPLFGFDAVSLSYGGGTLWKRLVENAPVLVVRDATFDLQPGETLALVGESGSGKSTIARAAAGLLSPFAGRIAFKGEALPPEVGNRSRAQRREIQFIFQNPDASLNPRARVDQILARPLAMFFGLAGGEMRERIERALHEVRLDATYARRYPDEMSGGERQRVAIARALVADPELLLCDEILSALDVSVQANIITLLRRLQAETNVAMLFISHDLAVVRNLAHKVAVLYHGQIMETGEVDELFAAPFHPYTHALLLAAPSIRHRREYAAPKTEILGEASAKGCAFAGRCPWQVGAICEEQDPPWRAGGRSNRIRCHHTLDELSRLATWNGDPQAEASASLISDALKG